MTNAINANSADTADIGEAALKSKHCWH